MRMKPRPVRRMVRTDPPMTNHEKKKKKARFILDVFRFRVYLTEIADAIRKTGKKEELLWQQKLMRQNVSDVKHVSEPVR